MYLLPTAGTFYVPLEYRELVAKMPPLTGDFARGVRAETRCVSVVAVTTHDESEPQP